MKPDAHSLIVIRHLQFIGYDATSIDQPGMADLHAQCEMDSLVVEVKSRIDDSETASQLRDAPMGEIVERKRDIVPRNRLSAVIKKAADQIVHAQESHPGLGVMWFRAIPELGFDDSEEEIVATLLGARHGAWKRGDEWGATTFYAAGYADFYRFPALDAAVVELPGGKGRLIVNPFSPRRADLKSSHLHSFFSRTKGILDIDEVEPPHAFVVRGEVDRSDQRAVQIALQKQNPGYQFVFSHAFSYGSVVKVQVPRRDP